MATTIWAPCAKARLLVADGGAAEHRHDVDALEVLGVGPHRLGHLDAELPRRRQHNRLRLLVLRVDVLEHGQSEGRGLPAAGLRLADHVVAVEQLGDGLRLDRSGLGVTELVERPQEPLGQAKVGEGGPGLPGGGSVVHQAEGSRSCLPLVRRSCISVCACAASLSG